MSDKCLASILDRLKHVTATETDSELAKALEISPQTLSSWKMRERIPYSICVEMAVVHGLSLDWLFLGLGDRQPPSTWERTLLEQLRTLDPDDCQAIDAHVRDKLRIRQLEQQLGALVERITSN
ncbi:TPA: helix-turn-helix domain-containing protein [Pseudomonas putida]|nr:helix-turn-helix domain-containing protein [Pseudomonas putida]